MTLDAAAQRFVEAVGATLGRQKTITADAHQKHAAALRRADQASAAAVKAADEELAKALDATAAATTRHKATAEEKFDEQARDAVGAPADVWVATPRAGTLELRRGVGDPIATASVERDGKWLLTTSGDRTFVGDPVQARCALWRIAATLPASALTSA
jgi:hypothetical protein